jgi:hypothetical protein
MLPKTSIILLLFVIFLAGCAQPSLTPPIPVNPQPTSAVVNPQPTSVNAGTYPAPGNNAPLNPIPTMNNPYPVGTPPTTPFSPAPGDEKLTRGNVFPDLATSKLLVMETQPVQVVLHLIGSLPNPCYQLRAITTYDAAQKRVDVELYSLVSAGKICTEVLQPLDVSIPLGSFTGGKYTVYINGEQLGDFDS